MSRSFLYTRKVFALYGFRRALHFFLQTLVHKKAFMKWFDFIETALPVDAADLFKVRLAMRPAARFVSRQFGVSGRIDALIDYYSLLSQRFPVAALSEFMGGYQIAEMTGQSGKKYSLDVVHGISKEGTLTITITDIEVDAVAPIAILTGIISLDRHRNPVFIVGMLRGPGLGVKDGKQVVVNATRDLNGLRPKQAVVHAAAALASWFRAGEIMAPSSKNEIAIKNRFKGYKILADHDPFWQEFAKEVAPDGNYHLPLPLPRRDAAEVQQKRRKDWLLRYNRIDAASASIKAALDGLAELPHGQKASGHGV